MALKIFIFSYIFIALLNTKAYMSQKKQDAICFFMTLIYLSQIVMGSICLVLNEGVSYFLWYVLIYTICLVLLMLLPPAKFDKVLIPLITIICCMTFLI